MILNIKNKICFVLLLLIIMVLITSCKSDEKVTNIDKSYYTVSALSEKADGKLINLIDFDGNIYQILLSENETFFNEIKVGDYICLTIDTILNTSIPTIIKKGDIVIEEENKNSDYKKIEVKTYWIDSTRASIRYNDNSEKEYFKYIEDDNLKCEHEWLILSDNIKYFNYLPGYYYKVKVQKKWLKDNDLLIDRESYDLELIYVIDKVVDQSYVNPYKTLISLDKDIYNVNDPIYLTFEVHNNSDKDLTLLPWGTPLEDMLTNDCLEIKYNDEKIDYLGIMVKRMPPTEDDYITIESEGSIKNTINILDSYDFNNKGMYSIRFNKDYDILDDSNVIFFEII